MNSTLFARIDKAQKHGHKLKKQKKLYDAMQKFEDALKLRSQIQTDRSPELAALCKEIGLLCNILAMSHLQQENF